MKMTIPAADALVGELQAKSYECDRYKRALERIANGSFSDADAAADFARDAVEIANEALGHGG